MWLQQIFRFGLGQSCFETPASPTHSFLVYCQECLHWLHVVFTQNGTRLRSPKTHINVSPEVTMGEARSLLHWAGHVLGQPFAGIQVLHSAAPRLALPQQPLQTIPLQGIVMPWQSGCSSCIPTASEKERAGFGPFTKQRDSFCRAARCKETQGREGRNKSLPHPSLFTSLLVTGVQTKAKYQHCRVVLPALQGKVRG